MMPTVRNWWWIPLLVVLGIVLKAVLLTPWVAGTVEDAAVAALAAEGLDAVEFVEVEGANGLAGDGLNVVIEGPAGDEAAAVAAVARREEIDEVRYVINDGSPADDGDETIEPSSAEDDGTSTAAAGDDREAATASPEPVELRLAVTDDGAVRLTGAVPDEAIRDAAVAQARAAFGPALTDGLEIDRTASTTGGTLTVSGDATSEAERQEWVAGAEAIATATGLAVSDETAVTAVEDQLNELFALDPIEFDVNTAMIRQASIPTLDAAARIIETNPGAGRLLVVGHTDGDGSESANLRLSEARALAVVDYLVSSAAVDPARLEADGRGESELLVSPELTDEDKQRNRRIEWELIS